MQNLVFPVTLSLDRSTIAADGTEIPVTNGMAVTVEIKTGQRRIIDYIFSPLVEVASTGRWVRPMRARVKGLSRVKAGRDPAVSNGRCLGWLRREIAPS